VQTVLVGYLDAYQVIVAVARCDALLSALIEHLHRGWTTVIVVVAARLAPVSPWRNRQPPIRRVDWSVPLTMRTAPTGSGPGLTAGRI